MTLLRADFPEQLEWLARATRWTLGGLLAKAGPARPGEGAEWSHDRDYTPGDDYRSVDWRVCARHDELVSRRLPADSDRCVYVLVDCSRSMSTGRPPKFDVARRTAAVLGAAALGHLDQLAVSAFADRIVAEFPPARGSTRLFTMLRFLDGLTPEGAPTDLARTAERLVRRRQRPGLAVVIGDFFAPESYRRGLEILRHHGYVPCVVHVRDRGTVRRGNRPPLENRPWPARPCAVSLAVRGVLRVGPGLLPPAGDRLPCCARRHVVAANRV
jgi:uncharacterized protein (DUF58 family)